MIFKTYKVNIIVPELNQVVVGTMVSCFTYKDGKDARLNEIAEQFAELNKGIISSIGCGLVLSYTKVDVIGNTGPIDDNIFMVPDGEMKSIESIRAELELILDSCIKLPKSNDPDSSLDYVYSQKINLITE